MSLVIFDCDGVLVESEVLVQQLVVNQLRERYGITLDLDEALQKAVGLTEHQTYEVLKQHLSAKQDLSEADWAGFQKEVLTALSTQVQAITGVAETLRLLSVWGVPFGVASNGSPKRIRTVLKATHLASFFSDRALFSGHEVPAPKPAPDLFLKVAQTFQTPPEHCWVIEDSPVGVQAALAARMPCVLFLGSQHAQRDWYRERVAGYRSQVAMVCETMSEVAAFLQQNAFPQVP